MDEAPRGTGLLFSDQNQRRGLVCPLDNTAGIAGREGTGWRDDEEFRIGRSTTRHGQDTGAAARCQAPHSVAVRERGPGGLVGAVVRPQTQGRVHRASAAAS